jgi:hypothetical protein
VLKSAELTNKGYEDGYRKTNTCSRLFVETIAGRDSIERSFFLP